MVMVIREQNAQVLNQGQTTRGPRLNWKANFICYKYGKNRHLTRGRPHMGNAVTTQNHPFRLLLLHR